MEGVGERGEDGWLFGFIEMARARLEEDLRASALLPRSPVRDVVRCERIVVRQEDDELGEGCSRAGEIRGRVEPGADGLPRPVDPKPPRDEEGAAVADAVREGGEVMEERLAADAVTQEDGL